MVSDQIRREWKENPKSFFGLKQIGLHCEGITWKQARSWHRIGVRVCSARKAKPVLLEHYQVGGIIKTNKAAVQRFLDKLNSLLPQES